MFKFGVVLGDGGGYLSGEDERGGRGGDGADPERGGGGLEGGVGLGGGGGRAVTIKDSKKDLSKLLNILSILFSNFIIALFFRRRISRVLKFIDLYLSRQACKLSFIIRVTGKFVSFPFKFIFLGD